VDLVNYQIFDRFRIEYDLDHRSFIDQRGRDKSIERTFATSMNQIVIDPNQLSLTESQIAALVVDENVGSVQLNIDILRQFKLTNRLACKILCALCEVNQQSTSAGGTKTSGAPTNGQSNNSGGGGSGSGVILIKSASEQRPPQLDLTKSGIFASNQEANYFSGRQESSGCIEEIDLFAEFCRQNSINLLQLLQTFDDEDFISDRIFRNTNYVLQPQKHSSVPPLPAFQRFWKFCTNLASTDKNGLQVVGRAFFTQIWQHNQGFQLNFIANCIEQSLIPKVFLQSPQQQQSNSLQQQLSLSQIVPYSELLKCQPDFETIPELNNWKFQRLYQILIDFTVPGNIPNLQMNSNCFARVLELFAWPLQYCPDLTVLGLLGVVGQASAAKVEILSSAIPTFLNASHPNAAIILHSIWSNDSHPSSDSANALTQQKPNTPLTWSQKTLLQALSDHYTKSPPEEQQQRLSRILDVAQDIKTLFRLLDGTCYPFVIDLACLASRREYLKLDKWLMDKFTENGENFIRALNSFLTKRYLPLLSGSNKDSMGSMTMGGPTLPAETLAVMLTFLQQCVMPPSGPLGVSFNELSQAVKKEVYTLVGNSSILLQRAPRHPPPGVVTSIANDYNRIDRLGGFPLDRAGISDVDKLNSEIEAKRLAQRTQRPPTAQNMSITTPVTRPSIANNANIDNLLAAGSSENYPVPPEIIQDKVFFIVNNLSLINLKQKAEEFKELFEGDESYYGWTAQYFSTKRAALEQNFQPLYANFLYELKNPKLIEAMTRETYKNIKHLLRLDKKADNINERTVLKNLGQWLGLLTLARNKPILYVDLDLKGLLVEAYHKGTQELLYVVPFLAEILKTTQKSKIFKPNNPFVLGLLRALVELRQQPNLKLNLEFQVEVLFNNLNVDLNKLVGQSNILNDEKYYSKIDSQLGSKQISGQQPLQPLIQQAIKAQLQQPSSNQQVPHNLNTVMRPNEFAASHSPLNTPPLMSLGNSSALPAQVGASMPTSMASPVNWSTKLKYSDLDVNNTASLNNLITIQPTLGVLNLQQNLKTAVRPAIELAISEWLPTILEKSLKICLPTAEQIIKKDFALDPDENHMQRAAHCLVRHLVSYMAMILCRDPEQIEQSLNSNLKLAFTRACPTIRKEQAEHAAAMITADNLELARAFVVKTAVERASADIDKLLQNDYELRRSARIEGHQYFDPESLAFHTKLVNEGMRLKPALIVPEQIRNYEELGQNIAGFKRYDSPYSESAIGTTSPFNELGSGLNLPPINTPAASAVGKASPLGATNIGANMVNQLITNRVITPNQFNNPQTPSGFMNVNESSKPLPTHSTLTESDTSINFFDSLIGEIMPQLRQLAQSLPASLTTEIAQIVQCMQVLRSNPNDRNYKILIVKILDSMYELVFENSATLDYNILCRCKELHILLLRALAETFGTVGTTKQITRHAWARFLTNIQEQKKSHGPEIFLEVLMQNQMTSDSYFDEQLVLLTETSMNPTLVIRFIHRFRAHFTEGSLPKTIDLLMRLKTMASQPFALELQTCIEALQAPNRNQTNYLIQSVIGTNNSFGNASPQIQTTNSSSALLPQRESAEGDPPGLVDKTERLLREWVNIHQTGQIIKMFPVFVQQMTAHGILKTDDLVTRFFRLSTEMCVESCYRLLATQTNGPNSLELRNKCYETLDAFTMLIVLLIKNSGSSSSSNLTPEPAAKINLLSKILSIISNVAIKDQENRQADFQHLAYYRILILLFIELNLSPPILGLPTQSFNNFNQIASNVDIIAENVQFQVLNEFTKTLRTLRPSRVPSFAFAWLDFLSHRLFIEKCLYGFPANRPPGTVYKGWPLYAQLLIDLIKFEAPFLRNVELPPSVDLLYKGTLKMFLVLLHDFPEFLCEYCYSLCDVIPCNAIQLRNLVLSAFPRKMRLPDPFTPNLKIDQLPEMSQPPKTGALQTNLINSVTFKDELDSYLRTRTPVSFLNNLTNYLRAQNQYLISLGGSSAMNSLNVPLLNALVLYVGRSAIAATAPRAISMTSIAGTTHMDVFQHLANSFDTEGRYLFLNAIANQLRYPNSHTHYFSSALLYLFAVASSEQIQEQITRVLVERLIIMRPHPWGLLVTFIELIKNPLFKFWNHEFTRCAPEIEK